MVFGAAPCSAGWSKMRRPVYLGLIPAAAWGKAGPEGSCFDITDWYVGRFGEPGVGERIFIRTRQHRNGWESAAKDVSALIPARSARGAQAPGVTFPAPWRETLPMTHAPVFGFLRLGVDLWPFARCLPAFPATRVAGFSRLESPVQPWRSRCRAACTRGIRHSRAIASPPGRSVERPLRRSRPAKVWCRPKTSGIEVQAFERPPPRSKALDDAYLRSYTCCVKPTTVGNSSQLGVRASISSRVKCT
jgi:hypothetical protein